MGFAGCTGREGVAVQAIGFLEAADIRSAAAICS
jgi:hypothetical protein